MLVDAASPTWAIDLYTAYQVVSPLVSEFRIDFANGYAQVLTHCCASIKAVLAIRIIIFENAQEVVLTNRMPGVTRLIRAKSLEDFLKFPEVISVSKCALSTGDWPVITCLSWPADASSIDDWAKSVQAIEAPLKLSSRWDFYRTH